MNLAKLVKNRIQIISGIERAALFGGEIWQTADEKPQALEALSVHIDLNHENFSLGLKGVPVLNTNLPIFISFHYRDLFFRLDPEDYKLHLNQLICKFPQEVRALEKRRSERFVFNSVTPMFLSMKVTKSDGEVIARIMDVSERGFCVSVLWDLKKRLKKDDDLSILSIDQRQLHLPIQGSIVYLGPFEASSKRSDLRLGISLKAPLGKEYFDYLKRRSQLVLAG